MSRYFFHVADGHYYPDLIGSELADDDAARAVAVERGSAIILKAGAKFWNGHLWQMKVVDELGRRVIKLRTRGHVQVHN